MTLVSINRKNQWVILSVDHAGAAIRLLEPDLPPAELLQPYFENVALSGRYSNFGPLSLALERRVAEVFFADAAQPVRCVATSSGTSAI